MGYDQFENARKPKIKFSQIAGKEFGVMINFRFSFDLNWPFKFPEYTSILVTLFRKAQDNGFWFILSHIWDLFAL